MRKNKSTKTHQAKAVRYLELIKQRKGEVHWSIDELGMTYSFEFNNENMLCLTRSRNLKNKHPYYSLTHYAWDKNYNDRITYLKSTNMIGKKIFDELKELYNNTKVYPE